MSKEIPLSQGKVAIVDDEDFEYLNQWKWHLTAGYAVRKPSLLKDGKRQTILMHRVIMNTPPGMETDHKDRNKLNNQKDNLRICTRAQNSVNKKAFGETSKYKGVSHVNVRNRFHYFCAQIHPNRQTKRKVFPYTAEGEKQAALWYNERALEYFGEYAQLNDIA